MKISGNPNQQINNKTRNYKKSSGGTSPFGTDKADIGGKKDDPTITAGQLMELFEKNKKGDGIHTRARWIHKRPDAAEFYHNVISSSDGGAYSALAKGVEKLDQKKGKAAWTTTFKAPLIQERESMWEAKDGSLIAATQDNKLHTLDPATGKEKWSFDMGSRFRTPVTIADDGTIVTFQTDEKEMNVVRLNPDDGSVMTKTTIGGWDAPIDEKHGSKAAIMKIEKDGTVYAHTTTKEQKPKGQFSPMEIITARIAPDGKAQWAEKISFDPPDAFEGEKDKLFYVDHDKMGAVDTNTGKELWKLEQEHERIDPKYGGIGSKFFTLAGEKKYKYVKFVDSSKGQTIIEGYYEQNQGFPQGGNGEDLICIDSNDPDKVLWRRDTKSSVFSGPLLINDKMILHISDDDNGTLEALDKKTGKTMWKTEPFRKKKMSTGTPMAPPDIPSHYTASEGKDGTLYIRAYNTIFGIDSKTGKTKNLVRTNVEIGDFSIASDQKKVYGVHKETREVASYSLITEREMLKEAIQDAAEDAKKEQQEAKKIEMGEQSVSIGGVSLPIHKK